MNCYGVSVNLKNIPELDPEFTPLFKFNEAFLKDATKPVSIAVERADGQMAACHTKIHEEAEMTQANHYYIDRLVKTMIWLQGGFRVYVNDKDLYDYLSSVYCKGGAREFDWDFMSHIYEHDFEIVFTEQGSAHGTVIDEDPGRGDTHCIHPRHMLCGRFEGSHDPIIVILGILGNLREPYDFLREYSLSVDHC